MVYHLEIDGWFNKADLMTLKGLLPYISEQGNVIEIGSHLGRSTIAWLDHIPETVTMYAMDHWKDHVNGISRYDQFMENTKGYKNLKVIKTKSPPKEDLGVLFDLVFIDGSHKYENVKRDIEYWSIRIKPGGIMCGHDYLPHWPGVVQAVDEYIESTGKPNELRPNNSGMWVVYL